MRESLIKLHILCAQLITTPFLFYRATMGEPGDLWDFGTVRRDLPARGTVSRSAEPPLPPMPSHRAPQPHSQPQPYHQLNGHQQHASGALPSTSNRYGSVRSRNSGSLRAKSSSAYAPASTQSGFSDASTVKNSGGTVGRSQAAYDTVRYAPEQTVARDLREDEDEDAGLAYDLSDEETGPSGGQQRPQQGSVDELAELEEQDEEIDDSKAILEDVVIPVIDSVSHRSSSVSFNLQES